MTKRDHWQERLLCPKCAVTGIVVLSQARLDSRAYHEGDENVRVETLPSEFRAEATDLGSQFFCISCDTLAGYETSNWYLAPQRSVD